MKLAVLSFFTFYFTETEDEEGKEQQDYSENEETVAEETADVAEENNSLPGKQVAINS